MHPTMVIWYSYKPLCKDRLSYENIGKLVNFIENFSSTLLSISKETIPNFSKQAHKWSTPWYNDSWQMVVAEQNDHHMSISNWLMKWLRAVQTMQQFSEVMISRKDHKCLDKCLHEAWDEIKTVTFEIKTLKMLSRDSLETVFQHSITCSQCRLLRSTARSPMMVNACHYLCSTLSSIVPSPLILHTYYYIFLSYIVHKFVCVLVSKLFHIYT